MLGRTVDGLLGRSLAALGEVAMGFQPERLMVMYANRPGLLTLLCETDCNEAISFCLSGEKQ